MDKKKLKKSLNLPPESIIVSPLIKFTASEYRKLKVLAEVTIPYKYSKKEFPSVIIISASGEMQPGGSGPIDEKNGTITIYANRFFDEDIKGIKVPLKAVVVSLPTY